MVEVREGERIKRSKLMKESEAGHGIGKNKEEKRRGVVEGSGDEVGGLKRKIG